MLRPPSQDSSTVAPSHPYTVRRPRVAAAEAAVTAANNTMTCVLMVTVLLCYGVVSLLYPLPGPSLCLRGDVHCLGVGCLLSAAAHGPAAAADPARPGACAVSVPGGARSNVVMLSPISQTSRRGYLGHGAATGPQPGCVNNGINISAPARTPPPPIRRISVCPRLIRDEYFDSAAIPHNP